MIAKLIKRVVLFYVVLWCVPCVNAQVSTPYFCSFETEAERQAWEYRTAARVNTDWVIGKAYKSTGSYALYTSYDEGQTAGYYMTGSGYCSIAYTKITLSAGNYNLYFDYKALTGMDYDDLRLMVSLVPSSTNIMPFATAIGSDNFNKVATAGKIFLNDPNNPDEWKSSAWHSMTSQFNVKTAGEYYLVFLFKQKGISEKQRFGACFRERKGFGVDNIFIDAVTPYGACYSMPKNLNTVKDSTGVKVTWEGEPGATYDVIYYQVNRPATDDFMPDTVKGLTSTEYTLSYASLPYGAYNVKVRATCADGTSAWAEKNSIIIYGPSDYCIEYWDLDGKNTKCTMGEFGHPYDRNLKIDYGYESRESYHTVHFDTTEYDPVTDYKLKTVLPGHWASVRIGQGAESGPSAVSPGGSGKRMSSAITYLYKVPEDADLFLLNYAPVLQFAAHHPENEQTQIVIDVCDQFGSLLDSKCLRSKFNSIRLKLDEVAGVADTGWVNFRPKEGQFGASGQNSPDEIKWHDWMIMGFNLKQYAGQVVQFRISLDPCGAFYHFAYIYLVPVCASAAVEGMSCSENATAFEVPDGFKYRWYKQKDRKRTVVCRDRIFKPAPDDRDSYYVDLMNKEDTTCFFTLEAHILPRRPKPVVEYVQTGKDCKNTVIFDATATRIVEMTDSGDVVVEAAKAKVSNFTWNFGKYGVSNNAKAECVFPNEGGIFPVTLSCEYGGCIIDTTFNVEVHPISANVKVFEKTICQGDVYTVNGKDYTMDSVYLDTLKGGSFYGCDSVLEIRLHVIPHTQIDTVVSVTSDQLPYGLRIDGKSYTFTGPKDTVISIPSRELRKCDSIDYNIHFEVEAMLDVSLDSLPEICSGDSTFTIKYIKHDGFFDSLFVKFDDFSKEAGFVGEVVKLVENGVVLPLPANVRPDFYHCDLIFKNVYGTDTLNVDFTVLYSSDIITQRWNDLLALKNKDNNGGYEFVAYQWFCNKTPLAGFTSSQYYVADGKLDFGAAYSVLLTRIDDGKSIMTCSFDPVEMKAGESGYVEDILVTFGNDNVNVDVPQNAMAYLYNTTGALCNIYQLRGGDNSLSLPDMNGMFILKIVFPNGDAVVKKLVR